MGAQKSVLLGLDRSTAKDLLQDDVGWRYRLPECGDADCGEQNSHHRRYGERFAVEEAQVPGSGVRRAVHGWLYQPLHLLEYGHSTCMLVQLALLRVDTVMPMLGHLYFRNNGNAVPVHQSDAVKASLGELAPHQNNQGPKM